MPKIIDIPYGTYLAYVDKYNVSQDYLDLILDIAYGDWRGYFTTKDRVLMPQVPSGAYRRKISYAAKTAEIVSNAIGNNKTVVAVVVGSQRYGAENKYHNITDVVDWRTCDTLSPDARAWAEQHYDDDVYDNTPTVYDMLPYALQYAQAGLRIFPLSPCDKKPLGGTRGCKEATDDISVIKKWWTDNPFYNIGIATGNGIVVIDVDEGDGKSGEDSIRKWQEEHGNLPTTMTSITGNGGRHLIYRCDGNYQNHVSVIPNVDIRADGGYIVAPPSIHPNGRRYKWNNDFSINNLARIDNTVKMLIGSNVTPMPTIFNSSVAQNTLDINQLSFGEGSRNDSLYRYGCSLQGKGLDDADIFCELTKANISRCTPPLSTAEVDKVYQSVISKPKGNSQSGGKMISIINKCFTNADDNEFFLARNNFELDRMSFPEYLKMLKSIYPYVDVHEDNKTGVISYSIKSQRLAAFIRNNDRYFFIDSAGEKPVPYWYQDGYYRQCNDLYFQGQIKKYIEVIDEELVEPSILNKVYKLLQTDLDNVIPANMLNADSNIINFENGLLHLDTLTLHPHTPDIYSTVQIPCGWNPQALSSPVFNDFLHTLSSGDKSVKSLLWEYIGYAVSNIPGYRCKQALILYGPGNTGKSQYLSLLEKLVGRENYCSMTLQQLEMRFGTSALWGKRLAGNADMGSAKIDELEKFKAITGGDTIDYEFKGKDRFSAKYTGLLIFCCNNLPKFGGDRGEHVYDRMITLPCNNVVPFDQRDRNLIEKIYAEREAIIYHSVIALKKLIKRGGYFDVPEVCQKAREEYKTSNDNVRQFLIDCTNCNGCKASGNGINEYTRTSAMYDYYKRWCTDSCYTATNRREFRRGIENFFGRKISTIEFVHNGNMYYPFSLKSEIRQHYYPYGV